MNVEHLEYFITVVETGSINRAARTLFISQPHLGKIIHDLEDEVGLLLLQRSRRGVTLTPEGREFLDHAHKIIDELREIRGLHGDTSHPKPAVKISLEVSMTKFSHIMESFIRVVLSHKDDALFSHQLNEGSPRDVMEDVYSGMSKIGVLDFDTRRRKQFLHNLASKHLEYHFLARVEPYILVSEHHPLIRAGKNIDLKTLSDYAFVRYLGEYEDFTYKIQSGQDEYNLSKSKRIVYTHSRSSLLHMIGNSDFYGIGIYDFGMQGAYHVLSVPIQHCDNALEFGYILQSAQGISPITQEFIEDLRKRFSFMRLS